MEAQPNEWAEDLSWVVGELRMEDLEGGFWTLHFGDQSAPHGGVLVLGNPPELQGFEPGQRVRLEGEVSEDQFSIFMAGTMYRVDRVKSVHQ